MDHSARVWTSWLRRVIEEKHAHFEVEAAKTHVVFVFLSLALYFRRQALCVLYGCVWARYSHAIESDPKDQRPWGVGGKYCVWN